MIAVFNSYNRIYRKCSYVQSILNRYSNQSKDNYILNSGIINYLWQSWNYFWRSFWLTYLLGGQDLNRNLVNPHPCLIGKIPGEAIHYLLFLLGKQRQPFGMIRGSFQEPTWGDITVIRNIASLTFPPRSDIAVISTNVIGALNVLGDTPKHFQKVRNCAIHLDTDTIKDIKLNVQPHYAIRDLKYPTEIIFSKEIRTGKIAYKHWIDELLAVIRVIYI